MSDLDSAFLGPFLGVTIHETLSIYLAALGGTVSELSGVYLIGLEGMMLLGGGVGFVALALTGSLWLAFFAALMVGLALGVITAMYSVILRLDQIIISIGIILFGVGFSGYLYTELVGKATNAFQTFFGILPSYSLPGVSNLPVLGEVFNQPILGYVIYALVPISWFVLFRTSIGLKLRAVGQDPKSADILGVNVWKTRFVAVTVGSAFASIAGFFLILGFPPASWAFNFTNGRGIIALALIRIGSWRPQYVFLASILYGFLASLSLVFQGFANVPPQFLLMIPYLAGIAMLGFSSKLSLATTPMSLGKPYSRTE